MCLPGRATGRTAQEVAPSQQSPPRLLGLGISLHAVLPARTLQPSNGADSSALDSNHLFSLPPSPGCELLEDGAVLLFILQPRALDTDV